MAAIGNIGSQSVLAASGLDLDSMGLEEMIMYVQQKRAESCQTLLEGQVKAVQGRTNEINRLNGMMSKLNEASAAMAGKSAETAVAGTTAAVALIATASKMGPELEQKGMSPEAQKAYKEQMLAVYKKDYPGKTESWYDYQASSALTNKNNAAIAAGNTFVGQTTDSTVAALATGTKQQLDTAITNLKTQIDSLNNSQQTDMLRLQGLTTKYNECFDTMSNVMKKFDGSKSGIVGNYR